MMNGGLMVNTSEFFAKLEGRGLVVSALIDALYALSDHHELVVRCKHQPLRIDCSEEIQAINNALLLLGIDPRETIENHVQGNWF
jgi:hypothetical protein